jgi:hypothetical protein
MIYSFLLVTLVEYIFAFIPLIKTVIDSKVNEYFKKASQSISVATLSDKPLEKTASINFSRIYDNNTNNNQDNKVVSNNYETADCLLEIMTQLDNLSKSLVDCIKNVNSEVIIIPVQLLLEPGKGHANILIYRKKLNQIEHFEPHGRQFLGNQKMQQYNEIIERWIQFFVLQLNSKLKIVFKKQRDVRFINSSEVCPRIDGLQTLEAWSNLTNIADLEPGGYCTAWSLFFTELCLKNPEVPSSELMNYIFNILERMDNITKMN